MVDVGMGSMAGAEPTTCGCILPSRQEGGYRSHPIGVRFTLGLTLRMFERCRIRLYLLRYQVRLELHQLQQSQSCVH